MDLLHIYDGIRSSLVCIFLLKMFTLLFVVGIEETEKDLEYSTLTGNIIRLVVAVFVVAFSRPVKNATY